MTNKYEDLPDVLTVDQVRLFLGIGRTQAYELVHTELKHINIGRRILVPKSALLKLLEGEENVN
ncbi:helix-turn-helix domain-containing protein [Ureibacillus acetophenoni]|uniref:Excisionase family DNA binding protein n=1 Tax=Ureibacillus acetophenoni TaxID=614649 RepID=A0A285URG8_9BACL|nr:helix-turn-helix domain-containing protein [Ureibacillus acetophenoni]SOC44464.1 excisionase family DNA binding protein [Ureibacillus acetophenoni]